MCVASYEGDMYADCGWCQRLDCGWHPENYKVDEPQHEDPLRKREEIETAWHEHENGY